MDEDLDLNFDKPKDKIKKKKTEQNSKHSKQSTDRKYGYIPREDRKRAEEQNDKDQPNEPPNKKKKINE